MDSRATGRGFHSRPSKRLSVARPPWHPLGRLRHPLAAGPAAPRGDPAPTAPLAVSPAAPAASARGHRAGLRQFVLGPRELATNLLRELSGGACSIGSMRLLVLGGTRFVGRAVVEAALARGDEVVTVTRGVSGAPDQAAEVIHADRADPAAVRDALANRSWDAVIDTWSGAPSAVRESAEILADRAGHYGYVSSRSVYRWPGPPDRPLQFIDARDLATWMLESAERGLGGVFNTVSAPGHATMGSLLATAVQEVGSDAELVWVSPEVILAAGIEPWTELPIWLPPPGEGAGLHAGDVTRAHQAGLRCRPAAETVADTWHWQQKEGNPQPPHARAAPGLD